MQKKCLLLLLSIVTTGAFCEDWSNVLKNFGPLVAKVEIFEKEILLSSGTAFVIDASGSLLTNAHVVDSAYRVASRSIRLSFPLAMPSAKSTEATIQNLSSDLDLAVLRVKETFPSSTTLAEESIPELMSEVMVMGFPLGKNFKATPGYLQAIQEMPPQGKMLDLSAIVDPGNSGGPVFNKNGQVVGIVTAKIRGANFNLAQPIKNVIEFLDLARNPVTVTITSTPTGSRIFSNGTYVGATPLEIKPAGRSTEIQVESDGYAAQTRTLSIPKDRKLGMSSHFELIKDQSGTTRVTIETNPPGARVWLNNADYGTTPIAIEADRDTKLRLRFQKTGFKEMVIEPSVGADAQQTIHVDLVSTGWLW